MHMNQHKLQWVEANKLKIKRHTININLDAEVARSHIQEKNPMEAKNPFGEKNSHQDQGKTKTNHNNPLLIHSSYLPILLTDQCPLLPTNGSFLCP